MIQIARRAIDMGGERIITVAGGHFDDHSQHLEG